jgi:DNA-binding CsgD family transcriptional regulator
MLPFVEALHAATKRGLRKLLTLGGDALRISVSVVPLSAPRDDGEPVALVVLGRRHVCGNLSIQSFANSHGLSPAEARVLTGLCGGSSPMKIASEVGVAISTVRSQIGSIRLKTGAQSIRGLVQLVATLPPLMEVLQRGGCGRSSSFDD